MNSDKNSSSVNLRTFWLTAAIAAVSSAFLLCGCDGSNSADANASPLAGTWTRNFNGSTVTITLKTNGSYTVDMPGGSDAEVSGEYTIDGDRLTLVDQGGNNASTMGEAVYRFAVSEGQLTLTPIDEPDENRRSVAAATWTKS